MSRRPRGRFWRSGHRPGGRRQNGAGIASEALHPASHVLDVAVQHREPPLIRWHGQGHRPESGQQALFAEQDCLFGVDIDGELERAHGLTPDRGCRRGSRLGGGVSLLEWAGCCGERFDDDRRGRPGVGQLPHRDGVLIASAASRWQRDRQQPGGRAGAAGQWKERDAPGIEAHRVLVDCGRVLRRVQVIGETADIHRQSAPVSSSSKHGGATQTFSPTPSADKRTGQKAVKSLMILLTVGSSGPTEDRGSHKREPT